MTFSIRYLQRLRRCYCYHVAIAILLSLLLSWWFVWTRQDFINKQFHVTKEKFIDSKSDEGVFSYIDLYEDGLEEIQSVRRRVENESAYFMKNPESVNESYNFVASQQQRKTLLRHECRLRSDGAKGASEKLTSRPNNLQHILVVDCLHLVFCQVRKVSSVTWRISLEALSKKLGCGSVRLLGSYSNARKRKILREYTKAIFVREPIERLVSAWSNKFRRGNSYLTMYGPMIVSKYRRQLLSDDQRSKNNIKLMKPSNNKRYDSSSNLNITFKEFASYIIDPEVSVTTGADMHWQDVYTRCAPCDIAYDFIGHFETKTVDAHMLFRKLGAEVPSAFRTNHPSKTLTTLRKELKKLPTDMIQKLYTKYIKDYKLFGYSQKTNLTQF